MLVALMYRVTPSLNRSVLECFIPTCNIKDICDCVTQHTQNRNLLLDPKFLSLPKALLRTSPKCKKPMKQIPDAAHNILKSRLITNFLLNLKVFLQCRNPLISCWLFSASLLPSEPVIHRQLLIMQVGYKTHKSVLCYWQEFII